MEDHEKLLQDANRSRGFRGQPISQLTVNTKQTVADVMKMVSHLRKNPSAPSPFHEALCDDGWIDTGDGVLRCPVCEVANRGYDAYGIGKNHVRTWDELTMVPPITTIRRAIEGGLEGIIDQGANAIFTGPASTGKTQCAALAVIGALAIRKSAKMVNIGHLGMEVREGYRDRPDEGITESQAIKEMAGLDLLAIDDIGANETGGARIEQRLLYLTLEQRHNAGLATILTTNLPLDQLTALVGARLINRLQPVAIFDFKHGQNFRDLRSSSAWKA